MTSEGCCYWLSNFAFSHCKAINLYFNFHYHQHYLSQYSSSWSFCDLLGHDIVYSRHLVKACSPRIARHVTKEMVVIAWIPGQNDVSKSITGSMMTKSCRWYTGSLKSAHFLLSTDRLIPLGNKYGLEGNILLPLLVYCMEFTDLKSPVVSLHSTFQCHQWQKCPPPKSDRRHPLWWIVSACIVSFVGTALRAV